MDSNSERLFNAIVIVGVALVAGCSSSSNDPNSSPSPGPSASKDAGPSFQFNADASTPDAGWTGW